jgi:hypothetical protein
MFESLYLAFELLLYALVSIVRILTSLVLLGLI